MFGDYDEDEYYYRVQNVEGGEGGEHGPDGDEVVVTTAPAPVVAPAASPAPSVTGMAGMSM